MCPQHPPLNILELISQLKEEKLTVHLLLEVKDYHSRVCSSVPALTGGARPSGCLSLDAQAEMLVETSDEPSSSLYLEI